MEVAVARAELAETKAYLAVPRTWHLLDQQLDLEDLVPAFKETCGLNAAVAALLEKPPGD